MDYEGAVSWLYGRQALGIKLGLGKMDRLLDALGDPQMRFRAIHVAGTNGKGSVVAILDAVLRAAGYKVGTTTSPHLVRFTERITIDGSQVSHDQVVAGVEAMRPHVAALDADGEPPTFFECVTALAFWCLAEAGVDWAVVETGMGGRLDATNIVMPALSVITDIGLDHQEHLGDTIADVAWEKAGIMKPGIPLVTSAQDDALLLLKARSHELKVPMSVVGEDYRVLGHDGSFELQHPNGAAAYRLGIPGRHQARNGALAVAACDALARLGVFIPGRAVHEGLANVHHSGRMERCTYRGAEVLIDGAHNVRAAQALLDHLQDSGWQDAAWIVAFCKDKRWQELLDLWRPHGWAVPVRNPRGLDPKQIADHLPSLQAAPEVGAALDAAVAAGHKRIVVAGSLFLAGEARAFVHGESVEEIRGDQ